MPTTEQIRVGIEQARLAGWDDEQIKAYLLEKGWVSDSPPAPSPADIARETPQPEPKRAVGAGEFFLGMTPESRSAQKEAGRASLRFTGEALKDMAVSTLSFLPGAALKGLDVAQAAMPVSEGSKLPEDNFLGRSGDYLMDVARSSYERLIDAQGEMIAAYPEEVQPLVGAMSTVQFGAVNAIPPDKPVRAMIGMPLKALLAGYGAARLAKGGIGAIRNALTGAKKLGDVPDAARSLDDALDVAEKVEVNFRGATTDELTRAAQSIAHQEEIFGPVVPRSAGAKDVPEAAIEAAKRERLAEKVSPTGLPESMRSKLAHDVNDEVLKAVGDDIARAESEVARRASYAAKLDDATPRTPAPAELPELTVGNMQEYGETLGRQYWTNRETAKLVAAQREVRTKQALSSGDKIADKAFREDLTGFVQKSGNAKVSTGDTYYALLDRVNAHPRRDEAMRLVRDMEVRQNALLDEMNDLNFKVGDNEISPIDNYLHQAWKDYSKVLRTGKLKVKTRGDFEKKRKFANYFVGMTKGGLTPRTLDIAEIMHITERKYGEIRAVKKVFADLTEINRTEGGLPIFAIGESPGEAYTMIQNRFIRKSLGVKDEPIFIHNEVWEPLKRVIVN